MATITEEQIRQALSEPWTTEEEEQLNREELEQELRIINIQDILPPALNLRLNVEEDRDEEFLQLVNSIRASGIIEPLCVQPTIHGKFQIVAGHRRFKASLAAGLTDVPCIVKDNLSDLDVYIIAISENLHRKDMLINEKSQALIALYKSAGYESEQASDYLVSLYNQHYQAETYAKRKPIKTRPRIPAEFKQLADKIGLAYARQYELLKVRLLSLEILSYAEQKELPGHKLLMLARPEFINKSETEQKQIIDSIKDMTVIDSRNFLAVSLSSSPHTSSMEKKDNVDSKQSTFATLEQYSQSLEKFGADEIRVKKLSGGFAILNLKNVYLPALDLESLQKRAKLHKMDLGSYLSLLLMFKHPKTRRNRMAITNWFAYKNRDCATRHN